MNKLNDKVRLLRMGSVLRKKGCKVMLKDKSILTDSYLSLTIINNNQYAQIKLKRKWLKFLKPSGISLLCSDADFLIEIKKAVFESKKKEEKLNLENAHLYESLFFIISELKKEKERINFSVSELKRNPNYEEHLSLYDFILPVVGLEHVNQKIALLYGVAVGEERAGGILLYNPVRKILKIESYIGFGYFGKYDDYKRDLDEGNKIIIEENGKLGSFSKTSYLYDY